MDARDQPGQGRRVLLPWRALLLAVLLLPISVFWAVTQSLDVILSLMIPPVVLTLVVIAAGAALRPVSPRLRFREGELVILYTVLSVGTAMGTEWTWVTEPLIYTFSLYASSTNHYATEILPYLPAFLFLKDTSQLEDFKRGGRGFDYFIKHLHFWWTPVLCWTLLFFLAAFAMLCINALMREQWTRRERLSFPVIQLPLAMTENGGATPLWRNRLFQAGFVLFFAIDVWNGLAFFYPALPTIPVRFLGKVNAWLPDPPWNAIGWTPIGLFPFIVALGTFLPTDLLFSVVFFFILRKLIQVGAAAIGYPQGVFGGGGLVPSAPYFSEQSWGAFLGLFCTIVWVARGYLQDLWRQIVTGTSRGLRLAFAGLVACVAGVAILGGLAGLSAAAVAGYVVIYLVFSVVVTHMRAELGPPTHEMAFMGPNQLLVDAAGTQALGPQAITGFAMIFNFANRIHRTDPMPSQLEAMKMGERSSLHPGAVFLAAAVALVVGPLLGFLWRIYDGYRWGAASGSASWIPLEPLSVVHDLVRRPRRPNAAADLFVVIGFFVVVGLNILRFRLPWFPLNPVGYALAMNFGVDYYWFGLLVALLIKLAVQRYSGLKGYQRLHLFALGVILGEFCAEAIWATVTMTTGITDYTVSINWEP